MYFYLSKRGHRAIIFASCLVRIKYTGGLPVCSPVKQAKERPRKEVSPPQLRQKVIVSTLGSLESGPG